MRREVKDYIAEGALWGVGVGFTVLVASGIGSCGYNDFSLEGIEETGRAQVGETEVFTINKKGGGDKRIVEPLARYEVKLSTGTKRDAINKVLQEEAQEDHLQPLSEDYNFKPIPETQIDEPNRFNTVVYQAIPKEVS